MSKKLDSSKLTLGTKKEVAKNTSNNIEEAISQIHAGQDPPLPSPNSSIPKKKVRSTVDLLETEHLKMKKALIISRQKSQQFIRDAILEKLNRMGDLDAQLSSSVNQ